MHWYYLSQKHALTNLIKFSSGNFVTSEQYYELIDSLLEEEDQKLKESILALIVDNLVSLDLSPQSLLSIHKKTETHIPRFVEFSKKIFTKHYSKDGLNQKINPGLHKSFWKLLETYSIPSRIGKTFKYTWKVVNQNQNGPNEESNYWDKVKLSYVPKIDLFYEHSTIFDLISLIGHNEDLMSVVYSQEDDQKKNWAEDVFSEAFSLGLGARRRQRFFQLLSEPLSQFV